MTFTRRRLDLTFELGTGSFGAGKGQSTSLGNLRASANITKAGGVSMSNLALVVYGAPLDIMNKLTILNKLRYTDSRFNTVTVSAGDDETGMAVCFKGIISEAWADMRAAPEAQFHVSAFTGLLDTIRPIAPTSYDGSIDVATIIAGIGAQMQPPLALENSGVTVKIANPYLTGTLMDQLKAVARAADINCIVEDGVVAIWPRGKARNGAEIIISARTGMVGYPAFTQNGIRLTTLYNPSLTFGRIVQVESILTPANGRWTVASVSHNLDSEMPNGPWFTEIECGLLGQETPIVG